MEQRERTLRPPIGEDVPVLVDLLNACDEADLGHPDSDEEEAVWRWRMPGFVRERDAWVVLDDDTIVAYAMVFDGLADVFVHPQHRGRGIGSDLLEIVEERALEQSDGEVVLKQNVTDRALAARALLERAGYVKSHHYARMEIDIPDPLPEPELPTDVVIRGFDPNADAEGLYDAYVAAWQQYEGQEWEPEGFATWSTELQGSDFDPALYLLAEQRGAIVGFVMCFDFPRAMGWVHRIGTLPEHRGRGIGRALLYAIFRVYRERGVHRIGLTVSSRNVSSARRLYESLGFVEVSRIYNVRKTLRAAG
jgi:mycothiol synthase